MKDTRKRNGVLYVSVKEFADRMGVTRSAVYNAIKNNLLSITTFPGDGSKYLDWDRSKDIWNERRKPNRKTKAETEQDRYQGGYEVVGYFGKADTDEIREIADTADIKEIGELSDGKDTFSIQSLDPLAFSDCWVFDKFTNKPLINPETKEHIYNWEMVDKKLKALLHNLQFQTKQGDLIPKAEVDRILSSILTPMVNEIAQIPNKFSSMIITSLEDIVGRDIEDRVKTLVQNVMRDTTERVMQSLQDAVRKEMDNE